MSCQRHNRAYGNTLVTMGQEAQGDKVSHPVSKKLVASVVDREVLASLNFDPSQLQNDFFDYSKTAVRKPWGYEYLIFQNELCAVWILYIKKGYQTSMHCHTSKRTSIAVLSGEAGCYTLDNEIMRHSGEALLIGEGVFHRTRSISEKGSFVMEIETPVNKRDLVRFRDDYGRGKMFH